jgi:prolyl 4-hydroxylase
MELVDFIHRKDLLTKQECEEIINIFEANDKYAIDGYIGGGINHDVKHSSDFYVYHDTKNIVDRLYGDRLTDVVDKMVDEMYRYMDKFPIFLNTLVEVDGYNIQRYLPDQGFKAWHYESTEEKIRLFVWMVYLNDVEDGGTEFMFQKHIEPATQGKLLFFPADWTHTHRGQVSHTKTKYILTGWISLTSQP